MTPLSDRQTVKWFHLPLLLAAAFSVPSPGDATSTVQAQDLGKLEMDAIPGAAFRFDGMVGRRVKANVENWLIVAPKNNPGLLEMFARRDSGEKPDLVPWAGEFVGKYLIAGVQAMRMSDDRQSVRTPGTSSLVTNCS